MTDDSERMHAVTDPQSPGEFRTNGILTNFDPWYEAFGVTEKNKLYLPKKIVLVFGRKPRAEWVRNSRTERALPVLIR